MVSAASMNVRAAAPPCTATMRGRKDGAGSPESGSWRLAARRFAVNQASPTHAVTATSPNAIQPRSRLWTSEKPSQKARPMIPKAG